MVQQLAEYVPELRWPNSAQVFNRMRNDVSCSAVLRAFTLPVTGTSWHVVKSPDVRPEVGGLVRNSVGLVEDGDSRARRRGQGISWDGALNEALLYLAFGHMFMEPVFNIGPPGPNDIGLPPGQYAHLARLAPVLPLTIQGMDIDAAGELVNVQQMASAPNGRMQTIDLDATKLIRFVNQKEGSDWTGRSVLREAYKSWFLKDQLERLASMIVERNGMGVPKVTYTMDQDKNQANRLASSFRAGEFSGMALPQGMDFALEGVTGQTVDPLPLIMYHSQAISRSVLAMFLDMGHDTGARALGETFVDFFTLALNSILAQLSEIFTEQVSRLIVQINFGEDEPYPEIAADPIKAQSPLTAEALGQLVTAGVVTMDETTQNFVRQMYGMPPMAPVDPDAPEPQAPDDTIDVPTGGSSSHSEPLPAAENRLARMRAAVGRRRLRTT